MTLVSGKSALNTPVFNSVIQFAHEKRADLTQEFGELFFDGFVALSFPLFVEDIANLSEP